MNIILMIAITTSILSGLWGWVAVSLGLISWAGFLGCTAYFACPQGGVKGLIITLLTCLSGVFWAMMIIQGSALQPEWAILGYVLTGIVAFLMCIQACQQWLSFVPGTFIGACATFAGNGDWKLVIASLLVGVVFGYAMKNSGLWLAARQNRQGEHPLEPSVGMETDPKSINRNLLPQPQLNLSTNPSEPE